MFMASRLFGRAHMLQLYDSANWESGDEEYVLPNKVAAVRGGMVGKVNILVQQIGCMWSS